MTTDAHRAIEEEVRDWFTRRRIDQDRYHKPTEYEAGAKALAVSMGMDWNDAQMPGGQAPYFRRLAEEVMLAEAQAAQPVVYDCRGIAEGAMVQINKFWEDWADIEARALWGDDARGGFLLTIGGVQYAVTIEPGPLRIGPEL